ncbi:hypothetical protein AB9G26_03365 [Francisella philomiragia]|uniref:hypothetical protein n=1 Tax=Francisella philomiragia TaxID=28110 RepID=UPI0035152956
MNVKIICRYFKASIQLVVLVLFPCAACAFVNIDFIPTNTGMYNLIAKEESAGNLKLELTSLDGGQYTSVDSIIINTGINHYKIITMPLSLNNNQIIDKIIIIPMNSLGINGTSEVNNFSEVYMMDANLQNANSILSISPSQLSSPPIIIKNNGGVYLIFGLDGSLTDTLRIYKLDTVNNTATFEDATNYNIIRKVLPLDENSLIIIEEDINSNIKAHIYSISKKENIYTHDTNLMTYSNVRVEYDSSTYRTRLVSDLDNIDITNAPSPYGVVKVY